MARHRRQRRRDIQNIIMLCLLLVALSGLYLVLREKETGQTFNPLAFLIKKKEPQPQFKPGNQVILLETAQASRDGQKLEAYQQRVAVVEGSSLVETEDGYEVLYQLRYSSQEQVAGVLEQDLRVIALPLQIGEAVGWLNGPLNGEYEDGVIDSVTLVEGETPGFRYGVVFPSLGLVDDLGPEELIWIHEPALLADNTAAANNQVLADSFEAGKAYGGLRLTFPSGRFLIGSQEPDKDYLVLPSNLTLEGNDTTLVVDGAARWFGLATGPGATEGLSNFTMSGLAIEAKDLVKGNQFIIMANHGQNWQIYNNRFTMVHAMSSHVFDLGGVQGATFTGNVFEGYAPELTAVSEIGDRTIHNFYSEVIQLDASSNNGEWDGGLIRAIDPNYDANNPERILSSQITIDSNDFLGYYDDQGQLVAYGSTVGQHSSEVGEVTITNNYFKDILSVKFLPLVGEGEKWVFEAVHVPGSGAKTIYGNIVE